MSRVLKHISRLLMCLLPFLCASCLSMALPKSAKIENTLPGTPGIQEKVDGGLIDTWELTHQVDDSGDRKLPTDNGTTTLIEFTDQGKVHFNKLNKRTADSVKSQAATYAVIDRDITITDDRGYSTTWPYRLTKDTLVIVIPEKKKSFHWRRYR